MRIVATDVGEIIRQGTDIRGLTTTASLWAAAAIGVTVGARFLLGAASTKVVALLSLLRKLRSLIIPHLRTDYGILSLTFDESVSNISGVTALLDRHDIGVRGLGADLEDGQSHYSIRVRIPPSRHHARSSGGDHHAPRREARGRQRAARHRLKGYKSRGGDVHLERPRRNDAPRRAAVYLIRSTLPLSGKTPKFETYAAPLGPMVTPAGNVRP